MSEARFDACFPITESWEGWHKFSLEPHDPGGATWCGLTQRAYNAWRVKSGLPTQGVRKASDEEIKSIFHDEYWAAVRGDDLWPGLDLMLFDIAINSGPRQAIFLLQDALRATPDGWFGLETLHAVQNTQHHETVLYALHEGRLGFWRRLPGWRYFGTGWTNRETNIYGRARAMLAESWMASS